MLKETRKKIIKEIGEAYSESQGKWRGCDWPTGNDSNPSSLYYTNMTPEACLAEVDAYRKGQRDLKGFSAENWIKAWKSAAERVEIICEDAELAARAADEAISALNKGQLRAAIEKGKIPARLESKHRTKLVWGKFSHLFGRLEMLLDNTSGSFYKWLEDNRISESLMKQLEEHDPDKAWTLHCDPYEKFWILQNLDISFFCLDRMNIRFACCILSRIFTEDQMETIRKHYAQVDKCPSEIKGIRRELGTIQSDNKYLDDLLEFCNLYRLKTGSPSLVLQGMLEAAKHILKASDFNEIMKEIRQQLDKEFPYGRIEELLRQEMEKK